MDTVCLWHLSKHTVKSHIRQNTLYRLKQYFPQFWRETSSNIPILPLIFLFPFSSSSLARAPATSHQWREDDSYRRAAPTSSTGCGLHAMTTASSLLASEVATVVAPAASAAWPWSARWCSYMPTPTKESEKNHLRVHAPPDPDLAAGRGCLPQSRPLLRFPISLFSGLLAKLITPLCVLASHQSLP